MMLKTIGESIRLIRSDRVNIIFCLIPILLGVTVYGLFAGWVYGDVLASAKSWVSQWAGNGGWGTFFNTILVSLLTLILLALINWTFVIVVGIFASPFNDLLSERIEKIKGGETPPDLGSSFKLVAQNILKTLKNELKKILVIGLLTILALLINFIPLLTPVSFVLTAMLFAVGFIDYSWGRHNLTLSECLSNYKGSWFSYTLGGAGFLFLMGVPLINLMALPVGVVFFTLLFLRTTEVK